MAPMPAAMTGTARIVSLSVGLLPYLGVAGVDTWMHERARKVPRIEQILHAALAIGITGFVASVFLRRDTAAFMWLAAFLACLAYDELGFHRGLAPSERRVHVISWIALLLFIGVWRWTERTG